MHGYMILISIQKFVQISRDRKKKQKKAQALVEATPTNKELCEAAMELASNQSDLMMAVQELANKIAVMEGGE